MINLKTVIQQLSEDHYEGLVEQFQKSRAGKYQSLLTALREANTPEEEISSGLALSRTAYYTLKSRLYEKIQEYLFQNMKDPRVETLRNVANIQHLVYNTPKHVGVAMLKKLEKELIDLDMPNELILVYQAFKKLHLGSPKYYEYTQLYNRHVAYTLGLDKAEDLLAKFIRSAGEYLLSKDQGTLELLSLMRTQMENVFNLYESHHLTVYKNAMNITMAVFIPGKDTAEQKECVEKMLKETGQIFDESPGDLNYQYLRTVFDFLAFEYFQRLGQYELARPYFENVNSLLNTFLYADHCCLVTQFLLSKAEKYSLAGAGSELIAENQNLSHSFSADDVPNYVNCAMFKACSYFYDADYAAAIKCLNELQSAISFKNFLHAEVELKLLLALCYSMVNEHEPAEVLVKSVVRKINEKGGAEYGNVQLFVRILRLQMNSESEDVEEKITKLYNKYLLENTGETQILRYLKMDKAFIFELSRYIKRISQVKEHRDASV
jgi:tetratricopeptide (TPR) repeat protein